MVDKLFSETQRHHKIVKNGKINVHSRILHLSPADTSGYEICPMRSKGCTAACLHYSGQQGPRKYNARLAKTRFFFENRNAFMEMLVREIENTVAYAKRRNMQPGIRLNGTSDIPWERVKAEDAPNVMALFPDVQFYDYTKRINRKDLPPNYRLVFSRSEENEDKCRIAMEQGMNIAVVFRDELPRHYTLGKRTLMVIDGDEHDWRYSDYDMYEPPVIVGLRAKGKKGRDDKSGFVVDA